MTFINSALNEGVFNIQLNRPDKFNSFNRPMALQLIETLHSAASNDEVRAIVIIGEGKAFCAGQDLAEALDANGPGILTIVEEHYNPIIRLIRSIEKPIIGAVNGVAAGAGANIALACDIILMSASASYIQAFSKIGLIPDSGGTFTLPRLVGPHLATALMMTGDKLSAAEAHRLGLAYKVFEDNVFKDEVQKVAANLASMPTTALGLTKRLLNKTFENTLDQQLDMERDLQVMATQTHDYNEGVSAFLEKRKPIFTGK